MKLYFTMILCILLRFHAGLLLMLFQSDAGPNDPPVAGERVHERPDTQQRWEVPYTHMLQHISIIRDQDMTGIRQLPALEEQTRGDAGERERERDWGTGGERE